MEINYDRYMVNKKLLHNRFAFDVIEITVYGKTYTRLKVYIFIPFLHLENKPIKIMDIILLVEGEETD